jgi:hypothetical protein
MNYNIYIFLLYTNNQTLFLTKYVLVLFIFIFYIALHNNMITQGKPNDLMRK